tara:strand:+ start:113 stop:271 length:159 start_codon:yes stop_codon:yes gene_type:complete
MSYIKNLLLERLKDPEISKAAKIEIVKELTNKNAQWQVELKKEKLAKLLKQG